MQPIPRPLEIDECVARELEMISARITGQFETGYGLHERFHGAAQSAHDPTEHGIPPIGRIVTPERFGELVTAAGPPPLQHQITPETSPLPGGQFALPQHQIARFDRQLAADRQPEWRLIFNPTIAHGSAILVQARCKINPVPSDPTTMWSRKWRRHPCERSFDVPAVCTSRRKMNRFSSRSCAFTHSRHTHWSLVMTRFVTSWKSNNSSGGKSDDENTCLWRHHGRMQRGIYRRNRG